LLPPAPLYTLDQNWYRLNLSDDEVTRKQAALKEYRTQLPVLRRLMESFVRRNELFSQPESANLPVLIEGTLDDPSTWRSTDNEIIAPVQRDPTDDTLVRTVLAGADIIPFYAALQDEQTLIVCAQMRGKINLDEGVSYFLRVKAVNENRFVDWVATSRAAATQAQTTRKDNYVCAQTSLAELGQPDLLMVGADTHDFQAILVDQLAWQLVFLP
jgi:hypothetical protein